MTNINISPEAVEHLCTIHEGYEQHGTVATLRALSAALKQSRAETAAAYELLNRADQALMENIPDCLFEGREPEKLVGDIRAATLAAIPKGGDA